MKKLIKRFLAWMRCECQDENLKWMWTQNCYSENIKHMPIHGKIGDDDIIQISHKLESDTYETCYVTIKQLKDAIDNKIS